MRFVDYRLGREPGEPPREWAQLFDLGTEGNVPTFYATCMLGLLAVGAAARAALGVGREVRAWAVVAVVAVALAIDEATSLHERFLDPFGNWLGGGSGLLTFAWVLPGAVLAATGIGVLAVVLRPLPAGTRRQLAMAAAFIVAGALGVEAISGAILAEEGHGRSFVAVTAVEEGAELTGALVALRSVAGPLRLQRQGAALSISAVG